MLVLNHIQVSITPPFVSKLLPPLFREFRNKGGRNFETKGGGIPPPFVSKFLPPLFRNSSPLCFEIPPPFVSKFLPRLFRNYSFGFPLKDLFLQFLDFQVLRRTI